MSAHESHPPSTTSLFLILISTFVFGLVAGGVVFLHNNTGGEGDGSSTKKDTKGFEILAYSYGGCERLGCASYRVADDGEYTYIVRGVKGGETKFEDELSNDDLDVLETNIAKVAFARIVATKFTGTCPTQYDGIAYRYDITYKGDQYRFDSCTKDLRDVAFFELLAEYFTTFEGESGGNKK